MKNEILCMNYNNYYNTYNNENEVCNKDVRSNYNSCNNLEYFCDNMEEDTSIDIEYFNNNENYILCPICR